MIKFQEKLCDLFDNTKLCDLPHFMIFEGLKGSGKHTICKYISQMYSICYTDVADILSESKTATKKYSTAALKDFIDNLYTSVDVKLLLIDACDITYREEPILLKFLEEPPQNIFIVMLTESSNNLLLTIRNRGVIYKLEKYTVEQLKYFLPEGLSVPYFEFICKTPGDVLNITHLDTSYIQSLYNLSNTICTQIGNATYSNILNISTQFFDDKGNLKDINKFELFLRILKHCIYLCSVNNTMSINIKLNSLTSKYIKEWNSPTIFLKQAYFENYLYKIKEVVKDAD